MTEPLPLASLTVDGLRIPPEMIVPGTLVHDIDEGTVYLVLKAEQVTATYKRRGDQQEKYDVTLLCTCPAPDADRSYHYRTCPLSLGVQAP